MSDNEIIALDLPAAHKYLNVLSACLAAMLERALEAAPGGGAFAQPGPPNSDTARAICDIVLAAHEVGANIVDHAYEGQPQGRIQIRLIIEQPAHRLVIEMCDTGQAFDPAAVPEPDLENGQIHGYGLFLVNQLMDEVHYSSEPGNNCWRLVKTL